MAVSRGAEQDGVPGVVAGFGRFVEGLEGATETCEPRWNEGGGSSTARPALHRDPLRIRSQRRSGISHVSNVDHGVADSGVGFLARTQ